MRIALRCAKCAPNNNKCNNKREFLLNNYNSYNRNHRNVFRDKLFALDSGFIIIF